jgi:hypothetical protein
MLNFVFSGSSDFKAQFEEVLRYFQLCISGVKIEFEVKSCRKGIAKSFGSARAALKTLPHPSPFKKAAVTAFYLLKDQPFDVELPSGGRLDHIDDRRKALNCVLVLEFALHLLDGATIKRSDKPRPFALNKIDISEHQWIDFVHAFSCMKTDSPDASIRLLSLAFESLAYEFSPSIRYGSETRPCHRSECPISNGQQSQIQGSSDPNPFNEKEQLDRSFC